MSEQRHYCTYCGKKRNESKMILIKYPLLLKTAWHCKECYSKNANKNKRKLFEEAALKKGYSLNKDGGKYADAWLEEAWQVHQLVD